MQIAVDVVLDQLLDVITSQSGPKYKTGFAKLKNALSKLDEDKYLDQCLELSPYCIRDGASTSLTAESAAGAPPATSGGQIHNDTVRGIVRGEGEAWEDEGPKGEGSSQNLRVARRSLKTQMDSQPTDQRQTRSGAGAKK